MRQPRIKISPETAPATYHCISRTVNGEHLFDRVEKEVLRRQLWQIADFCGVRILTYALMSNHFHVLVFVPRAEFVDDAELLRRYHVLYPSPTRYQAARLEVLRHQLTANAPEAVLWRKRQLALMGDVSQFMKLWKQRFTRWFNRSHQRFGTLWAERFKSLLVESRGLAVRLVAAYIDLNATRAGLTIDPATYRFCGYAEALGGHPAARAGLTHVIGGENWPAAQSSYRQLLFGLGTAALESGKNFTLDQLHAALRNSGQLPLAFLLRCRMRYLTDGAILGSQAYVQSHLAEYRRKTGRWRARFHRLPERLNLFDLATLRRLPDPKIPAR